MQNVFRITCYLDNYLFKYLTPVQWVQWSEAIMGLRNANDSMSVERNDNGPVRTLQIYENMYISKIFKRREIYHLHDKSN